ncbi:unnamed protein product [Amoebophrya sp. A120]|nr:unnamed protein product [Amoebophrya sp. A120]|eukprot:GSA120T00010264001.1
MTSPLSTGPATAFLRQLPVAAKEGGVLVTRDNFDRLKPLKNFDELLAQASDDIPAFDVKAFQEVNQLSDEAADSNKTKSKNKSSDFSSVTAPHELNSSLQRAIRDASGGGPAAQPTLVRGAKKNQNKPKRTVNGKPVKEILDNIAKKNQQAGAAGQIDFCGVTLAANKNSSAFHKNTPTFYRVTPDHILLDTQLERARKAVATVEEKQNLAKQLREEKKSTKNSKAGVLAHSSTKEKNSHQDELANFAEMWRARDKALTELEELGMLDGEELLRKADRPEYSYYNGATMMGGGIPIAPGQKPASAEDGKNPSRLFSYALNFKRIEELLSNEALRLQDRLDAMEEKQMQQSDETEGGVNALLPSLSVEVRTLVGDLCFHMKQAAFTETNGVYHEKNYTDSAATTPAAAGNKRKDKATSRAEDLHASAGRSSPTFSDSTTTKTGTTLVKKAKQVKTITLADYFNHSVEPHAHTKAPRRADKMSLDVELQHFTRVSLEEKLLKLFEILLCGREGILELAEFAMTATTGEQTSTQVQITNGNKNDDVASGSSSSRSPFFSPPSRSTPGSQADNNSPLEGSIVKIRGKFPHMLPTPTTEDRRAQETNFSDASLKLEDYWDIGVAQTTAFHDVLIRLVANYFSDLEQQKRDVAATSSKKNNKPNFLDYHVNDTIDALNRQTMNSRLSVSEKCRKDFARRGEGLATASLLTSGLLHLFLLHDAVVRKMIQPARCLSARKEPCIKLKESKDKGIGKNGKKSKSFERMEVPPPDLKKLKTGDLFRIGSVHRTYGWRCLPYNDTRALLLHLTDEDFEAGSLVPSSVLQKIAEAQETQKNKESTSAMMTGTNNSLPGKGNKGKKGKKAAKQKELEQEVRQMIEDTILYEKKSRQTAWKQSSLRIYACVTLPTEITTSSSSASSSTTTGYNCNPADALADFDALLEASTDLAPPAARDYKIVGYVILPTSATKWNPRLDQMIAAGDRTGSYNGKKPAPGQTQVWFSPDETSVAMWIEAEDRSKASGMDILALREEKMQEVDLDYRHDPHAGARARLPGQQIQTNMMSITAATEFAKLISNRKQLALKQIEWFRRTFPELPLFNNTLFHMLRTVLQGCTLDFRYLGLKTVWQRLAMTYRAPPQASDNSKAGSLKDRDVKGEKGAKDKGSKGRGKNKKNEEPKKNEQSTRNPWMYNSGGEASPSGWGTWSSYNYERTHDPRTNGATGSGTNSPTDVESPPVVNFSALQNHKDTRAISGASPLWRFCPAEIVSGVGAGGVSLSTNLNDFRNFYDYADQLQKMILNKDQNRARNSSYDDNQQRHDDSDYFYGNVAGEGIDDDVYSEDQINQEHEQHKSVDQLQFTLAIADAQSLVEQQEANPPGGWNPYRDGAGLPPDAQQVLADVVPPEFLDGQRAHLLRHNALAHARALGAEERERHGRGHWGLDGQWHEDDHFSDEDEDDYSMDDDYNYHWAQMLQDELGIEFFG